MPRIDALEVIERVRRAGAPQAVRLIILSALSGEQDVVAGLNLGADDYIAKPFSLREAVARVCSVLRAHPAENQRATLSCADLVIDGSTNRVTAQGRQLNLRGIEYRLREFLMSHPGRTFNRTQLRRRFGVATVRSTSALSTSMRKGCARSSRSNAASPISKRCAGSATASPPPAASEAMSPPSHF
jgi:two-component system phosphate regulon response regulator PhoB